MSKLKKINLKNRVGSASISEYSDVFSVCGIKSTKPRLGILKALDGAPSLLSAEDIFKIIKKDTGKNPDIVTIYRSLEVFEKNGYIRKVIFKDKINRYELVLQDNHHCHHAICDGCGTTEHIEDAEIEKAIDALIKKFKKVKFVKEHSLEFVGTCTSCKNHKTIKN